MVVIPHYIQNRIMNKKEIEKILNRYFELYGRLCYFNGYDKKRELPENPFLEDCLKELTKKKNGKN